MSAAMIQMPVTADERENIQTACQKFRDAKRHRADAAVLPEMFCCPYENACFRRCGEGQSALSSLAAELGMYIVGGPLPEPEDGKVFCASFVYGRQGQALVRHRKVHLFDNGADPRGTVLCRSGAEETAPYAHLDLGWIETVRARLPILSARRTDLYQVREP